MLIYHFNRMIQNKVIWFIFAAVITITFLSLPSCTGQSGADSANSVGKIGDQYVSRGEYDLATTFVQNTRRGMDLPPAATETQVWAHIAAIRTAKEMGLGASPAEIQNAIASTPTFQKGGRFDMAGYEAIVGRSLGLSTKDYERLVAQMITIDKLRRAVGAAFAPSPMEVEDGVSAMTDEITFQTAMISNKFANAKFGVTKEGMKLYYEEHKEDFALDDRIGIRYAIVPTSNFVASVSVSGVDVRDQYDLQANQYTRQTTNGVEQIPFEEVSTIISNDLILIEAADIARTNLISFSYDLANDPNQMSNFVWRAKARGYQTAETGLVSPEKAYFTGIETAAVDEFREAATELLDYTHDRYDSPYRTARGKRFVYLLQAVTNDPAHTPSFESLVDKIRPLAEAQSREEAFKDFSSGIRDRVVIAMSSNLTFEAAARAEGLNVSTSMTVSAESPDSSSIRYANTIVPAIRRLAAGEVSEVLPVFRGALLANVSNRKATGALAAQNTRTQISQALSSFCENDAFLDWMIWNLQDKGFESPNFDLPESAEPSDK